MSVRDRGVNLIDETSSNADSFLFAMAFFVGALWILLSRLVFDWHVLLAMVVPAAVLIGYAIGVSTGRFRLREDKAGDNLYYLGFLYTLISLGVGLYRYNTEISGVENIISDLGVGLGTTILGLFLRILFLQLRKDSDDYSEDAKVQLNEAVQAFRRDVSALTSVSQTAQTKFQQQSEEHAQALEKVVSHLGDTVDSLSSQVKGLGREIADVQVPQDLFTTPFGEAAEVLRQELVARAAEIHAVDFDLAQVVQKIHQTADQTVDAIQALTQRIASVELDPTELLQSVRTESEHIAGQFESVLPSIENLNTALQSNTQRFEQAAKSLGRFEEAMGRLDTQEAQMSETARVLTESISGLARFSGALAELPGQLGSTATKLQELETLLVQQTGTLDERLGSVSYGVTRVETATQALSSSLEDVTQQFTRTLNELIRAADK
ncbi:MAG: hypothetical protein HOL99_12740 [Halieaceae bacterium]|jgi:uncharacterized phage infection (PIP) family protein YhgE|nr:hypothetical protein [Halieaceae bacterium]